MIKVLKLLQLLCENCFSPFQVFYFLICEFNLIKNFLRIQNLKDSNQNFVSINIVLATANVLLLIHNIKNEKNSLKNRKLNKIYEQCFDTLSDFCLGPCKENQILLCNILIIN